jgi:hypothetical protein
MAKVKIKFEVADGVEVDAKKLNKVMIARQKRWNAIESKERGMDASDQSCLGVLEIAYGKASKKAKKDTWYTKPNSTGGVKVVHSKLSAIKCKDTKREVTAALNEMLG